MNDLKINIIRERRRTIALIINPDATVTVKAPIFTPEFFINRFIKDKRDWIDRKLVQVKQYPQFEEKKFIDGELFQYLGKSYPLKIVHSTEIELKEELLFPFKNKRSIKKRILEWYKHNALETVTKRVEEYAKLMHVSYRSISLSNAKKRWGACSHINELSFNWRLIMAPIEIMDYVVVHELAHITQKNHSKDFWAIVQTYCPDYKVKRRWLTVNGNGMEIG